MFVKRTIVLRHIIFTCYDHDVLMSTFALSLCLMTHNPMVHQYLSETRPPLWVLRCMHPRPIARKCRLFFWSVSLHICRCRHLLWLMALMLRAWKPIHHRQKGKKWWGEDKDRGKEKGRRWQRKHNGSAVLHSFKRLFITAVCCQIPRLYIHGGNQIHAKLIYGHGCGEMAHDEVTQTDCRWSDTLDVKCPV